MAKAETLTKTMPDGGIATFYVKGNYYKVEGQRVTRVSTIIRQMAKGPMFDQWLVDQAVDYLETADNNRGMGEVLEKEDFDKARKAHEDEAGAAAEKGDKGHDALERYFEHYNESVGEQMAHALDEIAEFYPETILYEGAFPEKVATIKEVISTEEIVYHREKNYIGRCDMIYRDMDGKLVLVDFKFTKGIYAQAKIQPCAYVQARDSYMDERIDRAEIWWFNTTEDKEEFSVVPLDTELGTETFNNLRTLHTQTGALNRKRKAS